MTLTRWNSRTLRRLALAAAGATIAPMLAMPASQAGGPDRLDPAALERGTDPTIAYLVHDTIRDGDLRVPATTRGRHEALWKVAGGYLVRDYNVGRRRLVRVTLVDPAGKRTTIAQSRAWIEVAVSDSGTRLAFRRPLGPTGQRSVVTVTDAATGVDLADRTLRLATLVAVTDTRVLVARRSHWHRPVTQWWSFGPDRLRTIHDQAAVRADVGHDRIVFGTPARGEFCTRVARLSDPGSTLWRSCDLTPHAWSPDGARALATHAYFDAAGTDRWWVVDGRTADRQAQIVGRLDWTAAWEDDQHFLTLAQGDAGGAAIIRCAVDGSCERASRMWETPLPSEPSLYYRSPPVVLAER